MVLEEGNHPPLRCQKFDMFVSWRALNSKYWATEMCEKGAEWKLKCLREEEA